METAIYLSDNIDEVFLSFKYKTTELELPEDKLEIDASVQSNLKIKDVEQFKKLLLQLANSFEIDKKIDAE